MKPQKKKGFSIGNADDRKLKKVVVKVQGKHDLCDLHWSQF